MKSLSISRKQQRGSIQILLGLIALLLLAGGAIAAFVKGGTNTGTSRNQIDADIGSIRYQGAQLEIGASRMVGNNVAASTITFDTAAGHGLFNGTDGTTQVPAPPATASTSEWKGIVGTGNFVTLGTTNTTKYYAAYLLLNGDGNNGTSEKQALCAAINKRIGDSTGTIPDAGAASTALAGKTIATFNDQGEICVQTTDGYTYVRGLVGNAS